MAMVIWIFTFPMSISNEACNPQDRLLINDGKGHFIDETKLRLSPSKDFTMDADFVDIDYDGDIDIVYSRPYYSSGLSCHSLPGIQK